MKASIDEGWKVAASILVWKRFYRYNWDTSFIIIIMALSEIDRFETYKSNHNCILNTARKIKIG